MPRTTQGSFDANTHFQNEPHQFPHPPASSFGSSVTVASPAKRMTFYKSGDAQFQGVKMAIHKRSFRCFDALLDDLSQKVPLPFGVRTITTPRGTHGIKHLEQLEDGGCYLCSDHRYVKPINMEAAGKRPAVWHHHSHPHNTRPKPSRPEEPPSGHQHQHRHPKRIVLVKNNDPTVRRSIILSRRTARSLRVFLDEISELMQCHVKKLYTLEGRKIDNIQSLMKCPSVLICVGRELFRPLLTESLKKLSDETLPGMSTRSHSSECHESKKNVNFGIETKKIIIHPRSDSSNRSTRFSLSSEKSYQNGLCTTPGQSGCVSNCPYVKEFVVNDDIKKRVLVNKDGSLSVEMKVRFRLFDDETLQWSTEIKKSSANVNGSVKDADYLQSKAEYSNPDSISASEMDEAFATKLHQKHIKETLCQNCCNHCQEYDIWKNPMHKEPGACKSPSSSASSHKVVHKKSSVDSTQTISRSSGECTEHVVEKASCFQQTMEEGDSRVEYCAISHCCNRSEVSSVSITSKSKRSCEDNCESHVKTKCSYMEAKISPTPQCEVIKVMEERPVSVVSNSSKVLESLKEDQDDEYDDLPPSVSRASHWSQSNHLESDDKPKCVHCCGYQSSSRSYLSPRPPSKETSSAVHSLKLKISKTPFAAPAQSDGMSTTSPISKASFRSHPCHCGAIIPSSVASGRQHGSEGEACSANSRHSQVSCKFRVQTNSPESNASDALQICDDVAANRSLSATSGVSKRSGEPGVCSCCGGHKRLNGNPVGSEPEKADSILSKPNKSSASTSNALENCAPVNDTSEREVTRECSESALSKNSNASSTSKISKKSNCSTHEVCSVGKSSKSDHNEAERVGERTKSATPAKLDGSDCIVSEREPTPASVLTEMDKAEEKIQERAVSPMSAHSDLSAASRKSHTPKSAHSEKAKMPRSCSQNDLEEVPSNLFSSQGDISESAATQSHTMTDNHCGQDKEFPQEVRSASVMSNKSNQTSEHPSHASEQTAKSVKSCCKDKVTQNISGPDFQCEPETEVTTEPRCSPLSNCSKISVKSHASSKNSHAESKSEQRVPTALSVHTNTSKGYCRSCKSIYNVPETTVTSEPNDATPNESAPPKTKSNRAISAMSETSEKSNACSERSVKSNVKSLASQEVNNGKDVTQNALSVTSPLPRSKRSPSNRSTHNNEIKKTKSRAPSGMSVSSNISLQSQRSSRCHWHSTSSGNLRETKIEMPKEDAKGESESLSGKSKLSTKSLINNIKYSGNQLDEPLSPTSTASVSLGLVEEHKGDDFDERSTSGMSHRETEEAGYTLETVNGVDAKERPRTEMSMNSAISDKSKKSHHKNCKTPVQALSPVYTESAKSADLKKNKSGNNIRVPSTSRSKSPSRVSQGSTKNTAMKERDFETVNNINLADINETSSKHDQSEITSGKATPESDCLNSSKSKNGHSTKESDRVKCKRSKCSSQCLYEINGLNIKYNGGNDGGTCKSSTSDRRSVKNEASRSSTAGMSDIPQNCRSLPQEMPNKNIASLKHPGSSSDSVLSRALSAADLLKEIVCSARPVSRGSKSVASSKNVNKVDNKSQKSSRSKHSKVSIPSECNNKELMPSCLPNTSSTEVVSEWLRNIPIDGLVYEMDVELNEDLTLAQGGQDTSQRDQVGALKSIKEVEKPHDDQTEDTHVQLTELCDKRAKLEVSIMEKQCQSSVQVMKVLLGPKLDRTSSLPEVSPLYGRKLSQSAQGLLDCFANLRLIDSDSKNEKHHKYNEIMLILQSLWLQKPPEDEQRKPYTKEHPSAEDEFNPRSSSGVDVSSGSTGSFKGSINGILEKTETTQSTTPPIAERKGSLQDKEEDEVKSTAQACECLDPSKVPSDPVTLDLAERVQGSPLNAQLDDDQENGALQEDDDESSEKNESDQTPQTTFYKSSGNESNTMRSQENTSSDTPPSVQRAPLTKRVSQDPDPIWVMSLLKKLEQQFMLHYADAMAEFKVRWDLDDNEMLDKMITELKEEVHKRIQSSISRELQKIQSRAGRGPRPPGNTLSRDSTVQTEQRRRRLRVMRNKSIFSRSDEIYTASGTENSDQRSDDEYCPCDACMKKKMTSRAVQPAQALSLAPVMIEFDLRKILQMKKDPAQPTEPKMEEQHTTRMICAVNKEDSNLEVVCEAIEEANDNTRGHKFEMADQEPEGVVRTVDEDKNAGNIKDVSVRL
ncbi:uncharacterized protein rp1l1a [Carassius auratus]|uniref:Uncharacterized protein rp1l1a n=1 Tax=Carassius auratus TaxID=7957 RepID=A0A6P6LQ12_CARAU|nr:uncharacterized protein LOC113060829 [Carassius auratus]